MWSRSLMPLMSTSALGCARRRRMSGIRLCPPASTLASSPYLLSSLEASSTEEAAERLGRGRTRAHEGDRAVPAAQHLGIVAVLAQQLGSLLDGGGAGVF